MPKKLLITEKPSVAMQFAKALKIETNRKNGYLENSEYQSKNPRILLFLEIRSDVWRYSAKIPQRPSSDCTAQNTGCRFPHI